MLKTSSALTSLLLSIFLIGTAYCQARAEHASDNALPHVSENHPLRLQRAQDSDTAGNAHGNNIETHLYGSVTRFGLTDDLERSETPLFDARTAFPAVELPAAALSGHVDEVIQTPPVLMPAKGTFATPAIYRSWLEKTHREFALTTSTMNEQRLVVVYDKYDNTGRTLDSFGLRFTTIDKPDLDSFDLSHTQVLVIDCGPAKISPTGMVKIRDFVARGGYLFTTDWMIDKLDQLIFPGFITWNGAINSQKIYDASLVGQNPVLFKHAVSNAHWKMDIHCHLIRVLNKNAVRILATSKSLVIDDPDRQGILAVVFPFERGYVMHMTAHFDRSQQIIGYYLADPAPVIGISLRQALAINFVIAGLTGVKP